MNTETLPDQLSRDEVYTSFLHGLNVGLPAPKSIAFNGETATIKLDTCGDLLVWRDWFGMSDRHVSGQPYPSLSNPADMDQWLSRVWMPWRGWHLALSADDPITTEQRDGWVSSGQAASFARYEAKQAAADPTGLAYSREHHEADDPRPVSPARGGQPHVVAVTDDGLVDETPVGPVHAGPCWSDCARPEHREADPVTVYFSFGHGQHDPDTGEHLLDKYVTIVGPSYDACREAMFASRYGNRWAFEYPDDGPATAEWIPRWTEHERIVLAAGEPVSEAR
jgi:hypothetical protein